MTSLTPRQNMRLSNAPGPPPKLPKDLEYEVWQAMNPHPEVGYFPRKLAASDVQAAKQALVYYEAMCQPITIEAVIDWLKPLVVAVNNGPDKEAFTARAVMITQSLQGLPVGILSQETQTSAMQTFKFFPSVAEIFELVFERGHKMKKRRWALAEIVNNSATSE